MLAKDLYQGRKVFSLLAAVFCQSSEGLFSLTKALLLLEELRSFFAERVSSTLERLSLKSKPPRLESKRLFLESERLLQERTARSMTNLALPIYLSVEGAISSDGHDDFLKAGMCPLGQQRQCVCSARLFERKTDFSGRSRDRTCDFVRVKDALYR